MHYTINAFFKKSEIENYGVFVKSLLKRLSQFFLLDEFRVKEHGEHKPLDISLNEFLERSIPEHTRIECEVLKLGQKKIDAGRGLKLYDTSVGSLRIIDYYDKEYEEEFKKKMFGEDYVYLELYFWGPELGIPFYSGGEEVENRVKLHDLFLMLIEQNPIRIFSYTREVERKEMDILPVYYDSIDTFLKVISYYMEMPALSEDLVGKITKSLPNLLAHAGIYTWQHEKGFSLHPKDVVEYYKMGGFMQKVEPYNFKPIFIENLKAKIAKHAGYNELIQEIIREFIKENTWSNRE